VRACLNRLLSRFDRVDWKIAVLTLLLGIQVAVSLTNLVLLYLLNARLP
jgi:hypothetical protein